MALPMFSLHPFKFHPLPSTSHHLHRHLRLRHTSPAHLFLPRFIPRLHRPSVLQAMKPSNISSHESNNGDVKETSSAIQPVGSSPFAKLPIPNIPIWARFALGAVLCLALPFYKKILRLDDGVMKVAETVAEVVEKVAEVTEKIASDVADALPEGSTKQTALEIERIAGQVDKDAEKVQEFLDKVDEIEDQVEEMMEPIFEEELIEKEDQSKIESSPNANVPKHSSTITNDK